MLAMEGAERGEVKALAENDFFNKFDDDFADSRV